MPIDSEVRMTIVRTSENIYRAAHVCVCVSVSVCMCVCVSMCGVYVDLVESLVSSAFTVWRRVPYLLRSFSAKDHYN